MTTTTCAGPQCARTDIHGRGLCNAHYQQARKGGELSPLPLADPKARFWSRVIKADDGCWNWPTRTYYQAFTFGGRRQLVHRLAYEWTKGPIPEGLVIDHLCRNPHCVNPEHLEAVTQHENVLRGMAPIVGGSIQRAMTHCMRGHEFSPENTYVDPNGHRQCRTCARESWRRSRARRSEHAAIRKWAISHGMHCYQTGALPKAVLKAYSLAAETQPNQEKP